MPVDEIQQAVELTVPSYRGRNGDWDGVLARVRAAEGRRRRSWSVPALAAVAAAALLVLFWPSKGDGDRVLRRALAAVDGGPVVHFVLQLQSIEVYDLETRRLRRIPVEHELWFDRDKGLHQIERVGGVVQKDVLYPAGIPEFDRRYIGLAAAYRRALAEGDAAIGEEGEVDGRAVRWITFRVRYPDVGMPTYDAKHEVAVDAETFVPVVWRSEGGDSRIRRAEGGDSRILRWETLPRGGGDFNAAKTENVSSGGSEVWYGVARVGNRTPDGARDAVPGALWLGSEFQEVPLGLIREVRYETGTMGQPPQESIPGLELCYGAGEPCAVAITETTKPHAMAGRGHGWTEVPTPGTLAFADGDNLGYLVRDGLYITIEARSREELIAAAEALTPIP